MSRHTDIPTRVRIVGKNHPAVQGYVLREIEQDFSPIKAEVIGHVDQDGQIIRHNQTEAPQETICIVENEPRRPLDLLDVIAVVSLFGIVSLLGWGFGLWFAP